MRINQTRFIGYHKIVILMFNKIMKEIVGGSQMGGLSWHRIQSDLNLNVSNIHVVHHILWMKPQLNDSI